MVVRLSALGTVPFLAPRKFSWYSFLLEVESTPGPWCNRRDYVNGKFQWHHLQSNQRPSDLWYSTLTSVLRRPPQLYQLHINLSFCLMMWWFQREIEGFRSFWKQCIISRGTAVAQWLRCFATNREAAGSIPAGVSESFIDIKSFRSHYDPGVDSACNRNDYQCISWGG